MQVAVAVVAALCSAGAAIIASGQSRNSARDANSVDRFEALTRAHEGRISELEREVGLVKTALLEERQEHHKTRALLRLSLRYCRELSATWGQPTMPTPPDGLADEL